MHADVAWHACRCQRQEAMSHQIGVLLVRTCCKSCMRAHTTGLKPAACTHENAAAHATMHIHACTHVMQLKRLGETQSWRIKLAAVPNHAPLPPAVEPRETKYIRRAQAFERSQGYPSPQSSTVQPPKFAMHRPPLWLHPADHQHRGV